MTTCVIALSNIPTKRTPSPLRPPLYSAYIDRVFSGRVRACCSALAFLASLSLPSVAKAVDPPTEPWSDPDPATRSERVQIGNVGFKGGAEYRANLLYINPISLNTANDRRLNWIEHRLRLDAEVDYQEKVRIVASADVMDGVLWGDNGTFGGSPSSDKGANINARNPNLTRPCIKLLGPNPLDRNSYGYGLCEGESLRMRRLYGEVLTPVGMLRVGRQPVNLGTGVQAASGDGRPNRFGFSRTGNSVDGVLFATKPLEGLKPKDERNLSQNEGFFTILGYHRYVSDSPQLFEDDVQQAIFAVRYAMPTFSFGSDFDMLAFAVHRWDGQFNSSINAGGARVMSRFGGFFVGGEFTTNQGTTREISDAYKYITNDPVTDQSIKQYGARAVVRYDYAPWAYGATAKTKNPESKGRTLPLWTAYLEFDYASGDGDPRSTTPLTNFVFAEDTNVGLLLFKHVLAFQSARAAAAGTETLRRLGANTFPTESIDTRGAFTNAVALFPQADYRPHPNVLFRGGVLFAWAQAPVNDPVASLQNRHGLRIDDDLVNFVGGKPGTYYGTEVDGRFQWRYLEHYLFDLEGAVLFPGSALQDRDGRAVRSVMVQGRTTFVF